MLRAFCAMISPHMQAIARRSEPSDEAHVARFAPWVRGSVHTPNGVAGCLGCSPSQIGELHILGNDRAEFC